jgi:hypothetical protein
MCRASCYKGMPPSTMASPRSRDTPSWRAASSIFTYLQEFFYFLPCGQNSLRESCGGIWLHESASLFMSCQVPFISILQKPLDTAWYLVIQGADFTVSPLFRSPRETNHNLPTGI